MVSPKVTVPAVDRGDPVLAPLCITGADEAVGLFARSREAATRLVGATMTTCCGLFARSREAATSESAAA